MSEAARYEASEKTWLHFPDGPRMLKAGWTGEYAGIPNAALVPLNAAAKEAKARVEAAQASKSPLKAAQDRIAELESDLRAARRAPAATSAPIEPIAPRVDPHRVGEGKVVEIPDDWRSGSAARRIATAVALGAPRKGTTVGAADSMIEAELNRRNQQAA